MFAYLVRRILYAVPILLGVNVITFLLFNFVNLPETQAHRELGKHADNMKVDEWLKRNGYRLENGTDRPYLFNPESANLGFLVRFDLTGLPKDAKITAAQLELTCKRTGSDEPAAAKPAALTVQLPAFTWSETNGTIESEPKTLNPSGVTAPDLKLPAGQPPVPVRYRLPGLATVAQGWYANPKANGGILLTTAAPHDLVISTRESVLADERPALVLTYSAAGKTVHQTLQDGTDGYAGTEDGSFNIPAGRVEYSARDEAAIRKVNGHLSWDFLTDTVFWEKSVHKMYFDFGKSNRQEDISREIWHRAPASLIVNIPIEIFAVGFSLTLAMLVAYLRGSFLDFYGVFACVVAMSISILFYIIGGQYLFAKVLALYPISGYQGGVAATKFVVMPVIVGFVAGLGTSVRFYRTIFLEEMNKEYVRTARAKGLNDSQVLYRHVMRNAMIPLVTQLVVDLPTIFIGSLVLENFFAIPGLGSYTLDGIQANDVNVVYSMTYLGAVLFIVGLLLTDVAYTFVDPRIRLK
ncbi:MAG: ABC transporter permease subunit [Planctomycetota bacterium]